MNAVPLPQPFAGIVPPLLTPLLDRDQLDGAGLERLLEHVLAGGVHGLFILGTTGEGPSLSYRLRREVIQRTCQIVSGRVPIVVAITDTAFVESVAIARCAAEAGAAALALAPPYYLPLGQPELREYLSHLLAELPLPLFLYNTPPLTKVAFDLETVRWAMDQPGIAGMKDSSTDLLYFHRVVALLTSRPKWTLLMGPEELLAESLLLGGHGGVPGGANVFPQLYVALFAAVRRGDLAQVQALHAVVQQVSMRLYHIGRHPSMIIKGLKSAVACLGLCSDFMAEPFHRFRAEERRQVETTLRELQDIVRPA